MCPGTSMQYEQAVRGQGRGPALGSASMHFTRTLPSIGPARISPPRHRTPVVNALSEYKRHVMTLTHNKSKAVPQKPGRVDHLHAVGTSRVHPPCHQCAFQPSICEINGIV